MIGSGIDNISELDKALKGLRLGLITNGSAVDQALRPVLDILHEQYELCKLFNTVYGVRSEFVYGERVPHYTDEATGLPVESIFSRECTAPTPEMLQDIDAVVFDIREAGCRYYEYLYCLANTMRACAAEKKRLIILDRTAPLGGAQVEGTVYPEDLHTMVGDYGLPNRIGLTIGEFACYLNGEYGFACPLQVVPVTGWRREQDGGETGLPWISPSPNLPHVTANLLYAGMCFVEGISNLSEGRGTAKPFEVVGAPWLKSEELARRMNRLELSGVRFAPVYFIPSSSKYRGEICRGVQIHVESRRDFLPVRTTFHLLDEIRELHPDTLEFTPNSYGHDVKPVESAREYSFYIDKLMGTDAWRKGKKTGGQLLEEGKVALERYRRTKTKYHLYE